jgi:hypothetical protein
MIKFFSAFIFFLFSIYLLQAEETNDLIGREIENLNDLIEATEKNLELQVKLRGMIKDYQKIQQNFLQNPEDNELLFQLVKNAHLILELIKEYRLNSLFDPAFLAELSLVSKPASKLGIPKP